jgi:ABC-type transport system involved in cytochrome c biogenesis ATPase subunit
MIEAEHLSKFYGIFAATKDVSFQVFKGEVVAFLGPNGAGKSTTMKILTGYLSASEGRARIAGFDMATNRLEGSRKLGYLPETGPLYPEMTPFSLLDFFAEARGMNKKIKLQQIEKVARGQVLERGSRPVGSGGKRASDRLHVDVAEVLEGEAEVEQLAAERVQRRAGAHPDPLLGLLVARDAGETLEGEQQAVGRNEWREGVATPRDADHEAFTRGALKRGDDVGLSLGADPDARRTVHVARPVLPRHGAPA